MVTKAPAWVGRTDEHLRVLSRRISEIRILIKKRAKMGQYNLTEQARLLRLIKKAKVLIAEVGFV